MAQGSTWYVDVNGTAPGTGTAFDPYTSIDYAVHQPTTVSGDLVLVLPGVYEETVEIVDKGITLLALEGATETTIDALGMGTVVTVVGTGREDDPVIKGFTITNGTGTYSDGYKIGGGILAEETTLLISHCIITANEAALGGGIGSTGTFLTMVDCEVRNNVAATWCGPADGRGGGLYLADCGSLQMTQCGIRWNLAGLGGGMYATSTSVALRDVPIRENVVFGTDFDGNVSAGGGVFMDAGNFWMADSLVGQNRATGFQNEFPRGGGLYFGEDASVILENVEFMENLAADPVTRAFGMGGAIASDTSDFEGRNLLFLENWAGTAGGGVWGPVTLTDSTFIGNWTHGQGGGAWGAVLFDSELTGNKVIPLDEWSSTWGAGAYGGHLERVILKDNVAYGYEGLIDPASFGGGAYGATVVRAQVFDNQADFGGGLADCVVNVSTIFSNTAMVPGGGGGLFFMQRGGSLSNSIVWHNQNGQITDFSSGVPVNHSDVQNGYPGPGNMNVDPLFWDEVARDFHLKPSSACIDMGDPGAPADPDGTRCDQGALYFTASYCGLPSRVCEAKVNSMDCMPSIGFGGTPSLTGSDDFEISASQVLNQRNGILVWSYLPNDLPFRGGVLCVSAPFYRTPAQNSGGTALPAQDCSGTYSYLFTQAEMSSRFMWVGRTFFAQYFYRDEGFAAPDNVGLSDGLRVTVCP